MYRGTSRIRKRFCFLLALEGAGEESHVGGRVAQVKNLLPLMRYEGAHAF
jgi:hypothetical protein